MNPQKFLDRLENKNRELSVKNGEYKKLMESRAAAEKEYSMAYAKELLILKADGQPVTIIRKMVEGNTHVANLKFQLDVAEAMVKACLQSMKNIHAVIDGTRSTLTWLRKEKWENIG